MLLFRPLSILHMPSDFHYIERGLSIHWRPWNHSNCNLIRPINFLQKMSIHSPKCNECKGWLWIPVSNKPNNASWTYRNKASSRRIKSLRLFSAVFLPYWLHTSALGMAIPALSDTFALGARATKVVLYSAIARAVTVLVFVLGNESDITINCVAY